MEREIYNGIRPVRLTVSELREQRRVSMQALVEICSKTPRGCRFVLGSESSPVRSSLKPKRLHFANW